MINLVISNNAGTSRYIVDPAKTPFELCSEYGLDVASGGILVNGSTLSAAQMDTSLQELGLHGNVLISQFKKLDNA